ATGSPTEGRRPRDAAPAITTPNAAAEMSTAAHASARSTISHPPVGAPARQRMDTRSAILCPLPLQPHTTSTAVTDCAFPDQFDASGCKRVDKLHQRVDISPDHPLARFHALDGRQRETRALGQLALIDLQQRPRGPHLRSSYHVLDIRINCPRISIHA